MVKTTLALSDGVRLTRFSIRYRFLCVRSCTEVMVSPKGSKQQKELRMNEWLERAENEKKPRRQRRDTGGPPLDQA